MPYIDLHLKNKLKNVHAICVYILCLSVCLFVSNKRQNGQTDPPKDICRTLHTQGRFIDGQNLRNLPLKSCYYLIIQEEKMPQIKQQLKVKFKDGRETLWKRGMYKI